MKPIDATPSYFYFWGHRHKGNGYGRWCFSQWWMDAFTIEGVRFASAEHYLMWQKARLFEDLSTADRVLRAKTPGEVQSLGRRVKDYDDEVWAAARYDVAVRGSVAKFRAKPELTGLLLSTGDKVLVEASPLDPIWGCGLSETSPDIADPQKWPGLNLLGFALMEAREALRSAEEGTPRR